MEFIECEVIPFPEWDSVNFETSIGSEHRFICTTLTDDNLDMLCNFREG